MWVGDMAQRGVVGCLFLNPTGWIKFDFSWILLAEWS